MIKILVMVVVIIVITLIIYVIVIFEMDCMSEYTANVSHLSS